MTEGGTNFKTNLLNKATIRYEYLHTNSTTHEFPFGALAELVDNSRDAGAKNLHIEYDSRDKTLSFLDDGCGMSREDVISIVAFGHSVKRSDPMMVGQYGNGLKSGSLRIAKDFILFTKKDNMRTCLFLSRSFHEANNLHDVFVPTPSFDDESGNAFLDDRNPSDRERHSAEMEIIFKYSPYQNADTFFAQFSKIKGDHGTIVVMCNLRHTDGGDFELDFKSDPFDIKLTNHVDVREEERNSLRAYLSVLYAKPRMKVYLREKKVITTHLLYTLAKPLVYKYMPKNLKSCAAKAHQTSTEHTKSVADRLNMAKSDLAQHQKSSPGATSKMADKNWRLQMNCYRKRVQELSEEHKKCQEQEAAAARARNNPLPLTFYFGLNIHHRNRYGMMVYNNGRLIQMYTKLQCQKERNDKGMRCLGVIGIVDVPYSVLAPTHNKQGFENRTEFNSLLRAANEYMDQYWNDIQLIANPSGGVFGYWKQYGYPRTEWDSVCTNEPPEVIKRFMETGYTIQCDLSNCLKWRHLEFARRYLDKPLSDDWCCKNHPNATFQSCDKLEELRIISEKKLVPKEKEKVRTSLPAKSNSTISEQSIKKDPGFNYDNDSLRLPRQTPARAVVRPSIVEKPVEKVLPRISPANKRARTSIPSSRSASRRAKEESEDEESEEDEDDDEEEEEEESDSDKRGRSARGRKLQMVTNIRPTARKPPTISKSATPVSRPSPSDRDRAVIKKQIPTRSAPVSNRNGRSYDKSYDDGSPPPKKGTVVTASAHRRSKPASPMHIDHDSEETDGTMDHDSEEIDNDSTKIDNDSKPGCIHDKKEKGQSAGAVKSVQKDDAEEQALRKELLTAVTNLRKMYSAIAMHGSCQEANKIKDLTDQRLLEVEPERFVEQFCKEKITGALRKNNIKHQENVERLKLEHKDKLHAVREAAMTVVRWGAQEDPDFSEISYDAALDKLVDFAATIRND